MLKNKRLALNVRAPSSPSGVSAKRRRCEDDTAEPADAESALVGEESI